MNRPIRAILKFSGSIFTLIAAMLFYNHLFVAAGNPGFFVTVYFDYYGEGMLELFVFLCFIPFILFSFSTEFINTLTSIKKARMKK